MQTTIVEMVQTLAATSSLILRCALWQGEKKQYIKGECVYVYTCVRAWVVRCVNYFQYGTLGDGEPGLLPASKLCTEDGGGEGDAICEVG